MTEPSITFHSFQPPTYKCSACGGIVADALCINPGKDGTKYKGEYDICCDCVLACLGVKPDKETDD